MDGCPQISDAVVDYYFVKKLAYSYIKRSQAPVCMMMDESQEQMRHLIVVNDTPCEALLHYVVEDIYTNTLICKGTAVVPPDSSTDVVTLPAPENEDRFYLIKWQDENGLEGMNHFITRTRDICAEKVLDAISKCGMDMFEGFSE